MSSNPPSSRPLGSILAASGKGKTLLDDIASDTIADLFNNDPLLKDGPITTQSVHLSSDDAIDYFVIFLNGVKRGIIRAK